LTTAKAKKFLTFNTYDAQRNMNDAWVTELGQKMRDGKYHEARIAIAKLGRKQFLMDGQQSCRACAEASISVPLSLHTITCKDELELADVFAQYDGGKARTGQHIAWAYACSFGLQTLPKRCIALCVSGLSILEWGVAYSPRSKKEERAMLLEDNKAAVKFVNRILFMTDDDTTQLRRGPVVAAMLASYNRDRTQAKEFWRGVRDGDMLESGSPQLKLARWLSKTSIAGSNVVSTSRGSATGHEMLCRCIMHWNEYRTGETERYTIKMEIPEAA
jgi:hypothetical protein